MCETCGCDDHIDPTVKPHSHHEHPPHQHSESIPINRNVLEINQQYADENRRYFASQSILAINLLSSPGSGKTSLLVNTLTHFKNHARLAVIEGDQQTDLDAQRIAALQIPVKQVNTGTGCHLDAHMIAHAIAELPVTSNSMLFIENVGNLVCPALFDLGEAFKVMLLSVTEGDDKPLKYPYMIREANVMLINKIDLLPYVDFDMEKCIHSALTINPNLTIIPLSVKSGAGFERWIAWLKQHYSLSP